MHLQSLSLLNFKNYAEATLSFSNGVNAFTGNNGAGKTNLLDAIHYLSLCKSYFNPIDTQNVKHDTDFFVIQGKYKINSNDVDVYCGLKRNQRKVFKWNNKEYERLADHIGLLPVVMISPVDSMLITEGSEDRRRFMDSIISQYDKIYLDDLINYNKVVSHRNALLKQFAINRSFDITTLEIWDTQLINLGKKIYEKRQAFISTFNPIFQKHYRFISDGNEEVAIDYESHHHKGNFNDILKAALDKDRIAQFTTVGTHKDDLIFSIGSTVPRPFQVKRFASQGQQKSFIIALKLAQFDLIKEKRDMKPILLLDDVFDKLDDLRVKRLMELVSHDSFGQIFITDTHSERVKNIFASINVPIEVFEIVNGEAHNRGN